MCVCGTSCSHWRCLFHQERVSNYTKSFSCVLLPPPSFSFSSSLLPTNSASFFYCLLLFSTSDLWKQKTMTNTLRLLVQMSSLSIWNESDGTRRVSHCLNLISVSPSKPTWTKIFEADFRSHDTKNTDLNCWTGDCSSSGKVSSPSGRIVVRDC